MAEPLRIVPQPDADGFEVFWAAYPYPRRERKALCRAKWNAITNGGLRTRTLDRDSGNFVEIELSATPAEIIAGVKAYADMHRKSGLGEFGFKDGGKYICQPSTFLNQGRWMDFA